MQLSEIQIDFINLNFRNVSKNKAEDWGETSMPKKETEPTIAWNEISIEVW